MAELNRLAAASHDNFELVGDPERLASDGLLVRVSIRIGLLETAPDGLSLLEREDFVLLVPVDFPFDKPKVLVFHDRFSGFPHVIWGTTLCLYQSDLEWNPADGMFGLFDRLSLWIQKAAANEMDPAEGPLEPPHHVTNLRDAPFVVRADAPCASGEAWCGIALLQKEHNRVELIGWDDLSGGLPSTSTASFAVILPKPLPMEFPSKGEDLFKALDLAGMDRRKMMENLAIAALLSAEGEPLHFVVGLPMRRGADGTIKIHIAVWAMDAEDANHLRKTLPEGGDSTKLQELREKLADAIYAVFEKRQIGWCRVLEDRPEIVARRDQNTPLANASGKKILVLGCGALGSWTAEMLARAKPREIHLVDNGTVKPGVLARQNYSLHDIGSNKADALAVRIKSLVHGITVFAHQEEAHSFIVGNAARFGDFDFVVDCTASSIFQMKLERDWRTLAENTPPIVSMVIDATAKNCLGVLIQQNSSGGIWDSYLSLKKMISNGDTHIRLTDAFYSTRAAELLFQPEPGCSDPTFVASAADVLAHTSKFLNSCLPRVARENPNFGFAWATSEASGGKSRFDEFKLPRFRESQAGNYRVRILESNFVQARAWAQKNNRERSSDYETGGLLWGVWDSAIQCIWIFDTSGPPPDSVHNPGHFLCGIEGTAEEHRARVTRSYGACGFVGHWHTHPDMPTAQSMTDIASMGKLVSVLGGNQRKSVMLIYGRHNDRPSAGIYIYESAAVAANGDIVTVGQAQIELQIHIA